jgi:hypothetical protein
VGDLGSHDPAHTLRIRSDAKPGLDLDLAGVKDVHVLWMPESAGV